jgi:hypothetical protein
MPNALTVKSGINGSVSKFVIALKLTGNVILAIQEIKEKVLVFLNKGSHQVLPLQKHVIPIIISYHKGIER